MNDENQEETKKNSSIRVMIVDDESVARDALEYFVNAEEGFKVVEKSASGDDALDKLEDIDVDVIFLDIEMPGMTGIEVASKLAQWDDPPFVVFATAYDHYAVEAFKVNAIDYVLKPYEPERFLETFKRIREKFESKSSPKQQLVALEQHLIASGKLKRLVGHRVGNKNKLIFNPKDVIYFEAKFGEVHAHLANESLIIRETLHDVLKDLDPSQFVQTHKAHVINLERVESVEPMFNGGYVIKMQGAGAVIPLSRSYRESLKSFLTGW